MSAIPEHVLFLTIVEQGSFYLAAEQLKMSASSLSRQLKKLEQQLGVQLLNRSTRSQSLTQAGKVYLDSCRRIQEEHRTTRQALQDLSSNPMGELRITATSTFSYAHLVDALADFAKLYPDIRFQLSVSDEHIDIADAGIDVAIRIGALQDSRLKSRLLMASHLIPCASKAYLQQNGQPEYGEELSAHRFVYMNHLPSLEKRQQQLVPEMSVGETQKALVVNDVLSIYRAVKSGMGISMLPSYLVKDDINSGQLVELFGGKKNTSHEVYLLFSAAELMPMKLRVFIDFMLDRYQHARS